MSILALDDLLSTIDRLLEDNVAEIFCIAVKNIHLMKLLLIKAHQQ